MSRENVRAIVEDADEMKSEPPRPLVRELPPADPFPVDALGSLLAPAARAIHDRVQAPLAICGQSVLAAATLAVQGYANVELPTEPREAVVEFLCECCGDRRTQERRRSRGIVADAQAGSSVA